jgi:hypothetical protein
VRNKFGGFLLKGIAPVWAMPFYNKMQTKFLKLSGGH